MSLEVEKAALDRATGELADVQAEGAGWAAAGLDSTPTSTPTGS